jgi:translation initiation factor 4G
MGTVTVRDATVDDVDFLAWVMLAASRSHLERGVWEYLNDYSEDETLDFLKRLAVTDIVHVFHHSLFVIAEVDGEPAAGMCGYDNETQGFEQYGAVLPAVMADSVIRLDAAELGRRAGVLMSGFVAGPPGKRLVVENVATLPAFRRQGLTARLLDELAERARATGYDSAQIGVFLGNEPARAAYLKAGFDVVGEARSDGWATEIGCPGTELLIRNF